MMKATSLAGVISVCISVAAASSGCGREPSPEEKEADLLLSKARTAAAQGLHDSSRVLLFSALQLNQELGRIRQVAETKTLVANNFATAAELDSAFLFYNQSVEHYRSLADRPAVHKVTLAIASLYREMGAERRAHALYTEALRLAELFGEIEHAREIRWALIPTCRAIANSEQEMSILGDLLREYTQSGPANKQAKVQFEFGRSMFYRLEYDRAVEKLLMALTLADQSRDSLLAIETLMWLAMTFDRMGKQPDAFQMYTDGLRRSDMTKGTGRLREEMLVRVGNIYFRNRQFRDALRFYEAALSSAGAMKNRISEGYLMLQIGHCRLESGERDAALRNFQSAQDHFDLIAYPPGKAYALFSLAISAQSRNLMQEAVQHLRAAKDLRDTLLLMLEPEDPLLECEQVVYRAYQTSVHDELIELLLQLGNYEEAFSNIEQKNRRDLFNVMVTLEIQTRSEQLTAMLGKFRYESGLHRAAERRLRFLLSHRADDRLVIAHVHQARRKAVKAAKETADQVVQLNPAFAGVVNTTDGSVSDLARFIPSGAALCVYAPTKRALYSFVVLGGRMTVQLAAVEKDQVLAMLGDFSASLFQRGVYADSGEAQLRQLDLRIRELTASLYGLFVRPLESSIGGVSTLVMVLPRELVSMPVHALRREPWRSNSPYLIENYMVRYLPYAGALSLKGVQRSAIQEVVAVGNSGSTSWDVQYELRDIGAFYKEARMYFDQQATLETMRKEHGDLLHIAAEFHVNRDVRGSSHLILSDGKSASTTSKILLGDIFSLPPFQAVVSSNLSTHNARVDPIQPLIFLINGTSDLVLTSYAPSRKAKKFFGEIFYTSLLAGETVSGALRQSQLAMIRSPEYSSPHVWGAFSLWGK